MLAPDARQSLVDALRPPPGYHVGCAIGTTFSLHLDSALTPPAAFALHAVAGADHEHGIEPLELLDSIRRHADRYTIFFQAGQVSIPARRRLFAYLEGALVPVTAPAGGVFHPKVWVLRFDSEIGAPQFRTLCASRNLTHDRAWDTLLRLDSADHEPGEDGGELIASEGLARFLRALPRLAVSGLTVDRATAIEELATQVESVTWSAPAQIESGRFHPIGIGNGQTLPFPRAADRIAVISPFLTPGLLKRLPSAPQRSALISRPDQIGACAATVSSVFTDVYTLDPDASPAADPSTASPAGTHVAADDPSVPFDGLHAKLYVFDEGTRTTLLSGSANATTAAFGANVEFLTELTGPRAVFGVDALLAEPTKDVQSLRSFLIPVPPDSLGGADETGPADDLLDQLRRRIAALPLQVAATPDTNESTGSEAFRLRFTSTLPVPDLGDGVTWRCWPITVSDAGSIPVEPNGALLADFSVSFEGITGFLANELTQNGVATSFVLTAQMTECPPDRNTRLLRLLLGDAERFLRYLLLLLSDDAVDQYGLSDLLDALEPTENSDWKRAVDSLPLLEALLRTLSRDPARLDQVNRLICDLQSDGDDESFVPQGLLEIWEPIWAAAQDRLS